MASCSILTGFSVYSVGAIYLTVMNLPRSKRFKCQNVILLSRIPGPSDPTHDMNTMLVPLVKELTRLLAGITMTVCTGSTKAKVTVRCALLCCAWVCQREGKFVVSWAFSLTWML